MKEDNFKDVGKDIKCVLQETDPEVWIFDYLGIEEEIQLIVVE